MPINLKKGQKIDLTKGEPGLDKVHIGLGWDEVSQPKGFFATLLGGGSQPIDCDASVIMLQDDQYEEMVYFGKLKSFCQSIQHQGDNLTGEGEGDDEVITIDLKTVPKRFNRLVFVVNIYDAKKRGQDFGMIKNAFIRIVNPKTHVELIHFDLTENYQGYTTLIAGELYRSDNEWKFAATGEATTDANLSEITNRFRKIR